MKLTPRTAETGRTQRLGDTAEPLKLSTQRAWLTLQPHETTPVSETMNFPVNSSTWGQFLADENTWTQPA